MPSELPRPLLSCLRIISSSRVTLLWVEDIWIFMGAFIKKQIVGCFMSVYGSGPWVALSLV